MKNKIDIITEKTTENRLHFYITFVVDEIEHWKFQVKFTTDNPINLNSKKLNEELNLLIQCIEYISYSGQNTNTLNNWIEQIILFKKHEPNFFPNKLITIESILKIIQTEIYHNLKNQLNAK